MNESIFNGIGEIYDLFRPSYPSAFFEYLHESIGIDNSSVIADVGAGTGILTENLLEICDTVFAIEPNEDMRSVAKNKLGKSRKFISVDGTAEKTSLKDHSVNFVTAAQSFHWFNRMLFKKECKRILKPNGLVILVWNCRDKNSEIVQVTDNINKTYCPQFSGFHGGMRGAIGSDDYIDFFKNGYETKTFQNDIKFNKERFIGLHNSASYRLKETDEDYKYYIHELSTIFDKYSSNGELVMPNITKSYIGFL